MLIFDYYLNSRFKQHQQRLWVKEAARKPSVLDQEVPAKSDNGSI